jgi:AraC family transcriptional regulator
MLQALNTESSSTWTQSLAESVRSETWKRNTLQNPEDQFRRSSTSDVVRDYQEAVVASSDALAWQDVRVIQLRHNLNDMPVGPSDNHCVILNLGASLNLNARLGKRNFEGTVQAGEVGIIPAGIAWSSQTTGSHGQNVLLLFLRPLFVRSAVQGLDLTTSDFVLNPQIGFKSKAIRHVAMSLLGELNEPNVMGRLYADSLAVGLAMQLMRRYSSLKDVHLGHGGMAPHRLRKAISLIDQHLSSEVEGRIALRIVARDVGMSYFHFSRAFKQSMGMTPTNYISERRIEFAKELIKETNLPISEIALRSGFSSQSHFTTSFRKMAGITPRAFRNGI